MLGVASIFTILMFLKISSIFKLQGDKYTREKWCKRTNENNQTTMPIHLTPNKTQNPYIHIFP